ncbi:type I toxin-antitoxin system SymE family toxin [Gilliamella sp. ESL0441]|uniref:SymE family type I addiction module toxin n=1 Tax=Gilliamella sp. ESL0441 TaxID=2704654 RepID=UPI001C699CB7|nr:SymE family type I addiction module toxin [Gilliamella sp. ESL0441]QYN44942.1 type I toxin-antitoxin system SymE family toxin [Gilliamella sp. ESL0441]
MAKTHSKLKSATGKEPASQPNERFYTIGYVPQGTKPNPKPQLTIKGRWLEQFGFYVGCPVIINIEQGKLVVEIDLRV